MSAKWLKFVRIRDFGLLMHPDLSDSDKLAKHETAGYCMSSTYTAVVLVKGSSPNDRIAELPVSDRTLLTSCRSCACRQFFFSYAVARNK